MSIVGYGKHLRLLGDARDGFLTSGCGMQDSSDVHRPKSRRAPQQVCDILGSYG
jgi:hypothetical protein